jgi:hypothetical protein
MELLYSTADLAQANRLASLLDAASLRNHVSGAHSASTPGFLAATATPSVGVWLNVAADLPRARELMQAHGFLANSASRPAPMKRVSPALLIGAVAIVMIVLALVLSVGH